MTPEPRAKLIALRAMETAIYAAMAATTAAMRLVSTDVQMRQLHDHRNALLTFRRTLPQLYGGC